MSKREQIETNEEYEISLRELIHIFRKGFLLMVISAVVFGVVAFGYSKIFIPKTYTSQIKMYVEVSSEGSSADAGLKAHNLAIELVNTYVEMLNSNEFFDRLSEEIDAVYTASQLKSMISFKSSGSNTELFIASVNSSSPTTAQTLADTVGELAPSVVSSLSNIAAQVKVMDEAPLPGEPSSPDVKKNTMVAAAVGFVLMLIFVYAKEMLDTKIRYSSAMTEVRGIPLLSAVPDFEGCDFDLFGITPSDDESEASNG